MARAMVLMTTVDQDSLIIMTAVMSLAVLTEVGEQHVAQALTNVD